MGLTPGPGRQPAAPPRPTVEKAAAPRLTAWSASTWPRPRHRSTRSPGPPSLRPAPAAASGWNVGQSLPRPWSTRQLVPGPRRRLDRRHPRGSRSPTSSTVAIHPPGPEVSPSSRARIRLGPTPRIALGVAPPVGVQSRNIVSGRRSGSQRNQALDIAAMTMSATERAVARRNRRPMSAGPRADLLVNPDPRIMAQDRRSPGARASASREAPRPEYSEQSGGVPGAVDVTPGRLQPRM